MPVRVLLRARASCRPCRPATWRPGKRSCTSRRTWCCADGAIR